MNRKIIFGGIIGFILGLILVIPLAQTIVPHLSNNILSFGHKTYAFIIPLFGGKAPTSDGWGIAAAAGLGIVFYILIISVAVGSITGSFIGWMFTKKSQ